jgi:hypothetical protein
MALKGLNAALKQSCNSNPRLDLELIEIANIKKWLQSWPSSVPGAFCEARQRIAGEVPLSDDELDAALSSAG